MKPQVRDGKIYWLADSDSALTKVLGSPLLKEGLTALLCRFNPVAETGVGQQGSLLPEATTYMIPFMSVQGLAALLVQGLSGCKPEQVAHLTPDWITTIGLQQSLTPSRNNGFLNMFGLMRHKAAQLLDGQVLCFCDLHATVTLHCYRPCLASQDSFAPLMHCVQ